MSDDTIRTVYGLARSLGPRANEALEAARCPSATSRDLYAGLEGLSPLELVALWARLRTEARWESEAAR